MISPIKTALDSDDLERYQGLIILDYYLSFKLHYFKLLLPYNCNTLIIGEIVSSNR